MMMKDDINIQLFSFWCIYVYPFFSRSC